MFIFQIFKIDYPKNKAYKSFNRTNSGLITDFKNKKLIHSQILLLLFSKFWLKNMLNSLKEEKNRKFFSKF